MSDPPSSLPKAIGSLAKKQSDVTRRGTQKLKFVPTLPQRRKQEEAKLEPTPAVGPPASQRDRGRGRGRGDGGRGRGRGVGTPPVIEMTASGPFAMGPAMAGSSSRSSAPRSNFVPAVPTQSLSDLSGIPPQLGSSLLRKGVNPRTDTSESPNGVVKAEDDEVYSDPDDGVEIVDMEDVRQMDWMAPESLRKDRQTIKKVKQEPVDAIEIQGSGAVDPSNSLNLSESDEEEELEDIIEDFAVQGPTSFPESITEERLYFFQFPTPFPTFTSKTTNVMDVDAVPEMACKKVSFALDVKPDKTEAPNLVSGEPPKCVDGVIGQLEVYKSGAVKIRLANSILLDVNAATQPSFLQQVVCLNKADKQLTSLGEVNKQFVVSPNVDALLKALENEENAPTSLEAEEMYLKIDQTQ